MDGVADVLVDVAAGFWLVDCTEVPRLDKDEVVDVSVVPEEMEVVLDDNEALAAVDTSELLSVENGYGSSEVVSLVSQQLVPPRPCPAAPAQHQLLPFASQRLTSV